MERYKRIMTFSESLSQNNCPIIFDKGALLLDNKLQKNILQLQFKNVGMKLIEAVYVSINCLDIEMKSVEIIEKKYLDLSVNYNETFGADQAIELESELSRNFIFSIDKIFYTDNTTCDYMGEMCFLESATNIDELGDLSKQFKREAHKKIPLIECKYVPKKLKNNWYCTCGALNDQANNKCGLCGFDKTDLFALLDVEYLQSQQNEYLKQKAIEAEENKRLEEQRSELLRLQNEERIKKRKKFKKRIVIFLILFFFIGAFSIVFYKFGVPEIQYHSALRAIENSQYEKAYQIFEELGDYKDSPEQIMSGKYKHGMECISKEDYENGYAILEALGDYSDAAEQIIISKYTVANQLTENENYKEALEIYADILDYKDSYDKSVSTRYLYGKQLMESRDYSEAAKSFYQIQGYEDAYDLYQTCCYNYAEKCFRDGNYTEASSYYASSVLKYEDASEKEKESQYQYVKNSYTTQDSTTRSYLEWLASADYKDSKKLYNELFKLEVEITVNNSPSDRTYSSTSLSKYDNWYFHIYVSNGAMNKEYKLKYYLTFPDGGVKTTTTDGLRLTSHDVIYGYYSANAYAGETGTATLKVYDSSGNFLADKSVKIY